MIIPLPEWGPDRDDHSPSFTNTAVNVVPRPDGWGPFQSYGALSEALSADCRGAFSCLDSAGNRYNFAATAANLYSLASDNTWTQVSKSTNAYSADAYWDFCTFGDRVIAVNGVDAPQSITLPVSGNFADLAGSPPIARYVDATQNFVFMTGISSRPNHVDWCGLQDAEFWTNGERLAGSQELPVGGKTLGVVDTVGGAYVMQKDRIQPMVENLLADEVFTFPDVQSFIGTESAHSVVSFGLGFAFVSSSGFYVGPQLREIGFAKVNKTFLSEVSMSDIHEVQGVYDFANHMVWWRYPLEAGGSSVIGYHPQLDRWAKLDESPEFLVNFGTTAKSIDDFSIYTFDTIPYPLDSSVWKGGAPFLGAVKSRVMGFYNGPNMQATIDTADVQTGPGRTLVTGASAHVDAPTHTLAIGSKPHQYSALTMGADTAPHAETNVVPMRSEGRFHRIRMKIPASTVWTLANRIEIPDENLIQTGVR